MSSPERQRCHDSSGVGKLLHQSGNKALSSEYSSSFKYAKTTREVSYGRAFSSNPAIFLRSPEGARGPDAYRRGFRKLAQKGTASPGHFESHTHAAYKRRVDALASSVLNGSYVDKNRSPSRQTAAQHLSGPASDHRPSSASPTRARTFSTSEVTRRSHGGTSRSVRTGSMTSPHGPGSSLKIPPPLIAHGASLPASLTPDVVPLDVYAVKKYHQRTATGSAGDTQPPPLPYPMNDPTNSNTNSASTTTISHDALEQPSFASTASSSAAGSVDTPPTSVRGEALSVGVTPRAQYVEAVATASPRSDVSDFAVQVSAPPAVDVCVGGDTEEDHVKSEAEQEARRQALIEELMAKRGLQRTTNSAVQTDAALSGEESAGAGDLEQANVVSEWSVDLRLVAPEVQDAHALAAALAVSVSNRDMSTDADVALHLKVLKAVETGRQLRHKKEHEALMQMHAARHLNPNPYTDYSAPARAAAAALEQADQLRLRAEVSHLVHNPPPLIEEQTSEFYGGPMSTRASTALELAAAPQDRTDAERRAARALWNDLRYAPSTNVVESSRVQSPASFHPQSYTGELQRRLQSTTPRSRRSGGRGRFSIGSITPRQPPRDAPATVRTADPRESLVMTPRGGTGIGIPRLAIPRATPGATPHGGSSTPRGTTPRQLPAHLRVMNSPMFVSGPTPSAALR